MPVALFDLDDTLFDHRHGTRAAQGILRERHEALRFWDEAAFARRHSDLLEAFHLEVLAGHLTVDEARVRRFSALFAEAGRPLSTAESEAVAVEYRDAYRASWRLVPGALELLRALHGRVGLGVVTNNVVEEQTRKVRDLGLEPLLDAIVISEAVGVSKPDRRIFEIALERLGCRASEAVMVGDSWATDIAGAVGAGLRAVWFNPVGAPRPAGYADVVETAALDSAAVSAILGCVGVEEG